MVFNINMTLIKDMTLTIHERKGYMDTHANAHVREKIIFPDQMLGQPINRKVTIEIE